MFRECIVLMGAVEGVPADDFDYFGSEPTNGVHA